MFTKIFRVLLVVSCCISVIKSGTTKAVTVLKCCKSGETLQIRKENDFTCVPGNDSSPMIYSPRIRNLLDQAPDHWTIKTSSFPDCGAFAPKILKNIGVSQSFLLFDNGKLLLLESKLHVSPSKYCYNSNMALYCSDEPVKIKVKKCCGQGAVYSETKKSCIAMNVTDYKINIGDGKSLVEGFAPCDSSLLIVGKLHEADLRMDGSLDILTLKTVLPAESFCLEHVLENAGQSASIFACHDHLPSTVAPADDDMESGVSVSTSDLRLRLYPAGLLLSAVFLAATLVAGTVLPATHHHMMHWRCQTKHVACLLVGDVVLATTQLAGNSITGPFCIIIAIVMHFSFLAAFFWLNTMCFNIWWTFRDLRPGTLEKRQETCRLRLYGVYAWGVPLLISLIALILDTLPKNPEYNFLRPRFGEKTCWFPGDMEILTYFFGPIGVLLVINLLLFAATARELTCGLWKRELVKSTTERAALGRVCMKLVVVMGVTWIADVISWAVGGPQALWYITDLINAFQGVFIFIVVACQPQVWTAIKRLWCKRQSLAADITGNGNHHSSSSHGLPSYGESVTNHSVSNTTRSIPLETSC